MNVLDEPTIIKGVDYWQNWLDTPTEHRRWIEEGF
jgi:hypothetical protein